MTDYSIFKLDLTFTITFQGKKFSKSLNNYPNYRRYWDINNNSEVKIQNVTTNVRPYRLSTSYGKMFLLYVPKIYYFGTLLTYNLNSDRNKIFGLLIFEKTFLPKNKTTFCLDTFQFLYQKRKAFVSTMSINSHNHIPFNHLQNTNSNFITKLPKTDFQSLIKFQQQQLEFI